jgi:hypothetical protein
MGSRLVSVLAKAPAALAAAGLLACGSSEGDGLASSPAAGSTLSGVYELEGVTAQAANGRQRPISGRLQLHVDGDRYQVDFVLDTTDPASTSGAPVQVRGAGNGFLVGGVFTGTTEERVTTPGAAAPDPELRVVSTSEARIDAAGQLHVELQNWPGEGQVYSPSVTVLQGRRVGPLENVAER